MPSTISVEEQIIVSLRQISRAIDLYSRYLLDRSGLTAPQLATLRTLITNETATPKCLAGQLHLSQATMAGILSRLQKQRLLQRTRSPSDGRSANISITAKGRRLAVKAPSLLRDHFRAELAKLTVADQKQLLAALQQIARMMRAEDKEVSPFLFNEAVAQGGRKSAKRRVVSAAE